MIMYLFRIIKIIYLNLQLYIYRYIFIKANTNNDLNTPNDYNQFKNYI